MVRLQVNTDQAIPRRKSSNVFTPKSPSRKETGFDFIAETPRVMSPKASARSTAKKPLSPTKSPRGNSSPRKASHHHSQAVAGHTAPVVVKLESPTSISMKNSLIIQSSDATFDNYYKAMMIRKKLPMA